MKKAEKTVLSALEDFSYLQLAEDVETLIREIQERATKLDIYQREIQRRIDLLK